MEKYPQVQNYIKQIELKLKDIDQKTKRSIIQEIKNHLNEKIGSFEQKLNAPDLSSEKIRSILDEFGSPEEISMEYKRQLLDDPDHRSSQKKFPNKIITPLLIGVIIIISLLIVINFYLDREPDEKEKDMIIYGGQGLDSIKLGDNYNKTIEIYGSPDNEIKTGKYIWIDYNEKNGIDILLNNETDKIVEIRFNPGFKGTTSNGISLNSDLEEVLRISDDATRTIKVNSVEESDGSLGSNKVLYEIYNDGGLVSYKFIDANNGILYWFNSDEKITQIVVISTK